MVMNIMFDRYAFHGANPNFVKQLLLDGIKHILLKGIPETNKRTISINLDS